MVGKVVCFKVLLDKKEMTISEVVLQRFGGGEVGGGAVNAKLIKGGGFQTFT